MLLQFTIENHRSICEQQNFSMIASSLSDNEAGIIVSDALPGHRILPASIVYGANASGKSNLIAAFKFMTEAVLKSHRSGEPGGSVPRRPFALDNACKARPTHCEVEFISHGTRYQYGFECDDSIFTREWLYSYPKRYQRKLFEREEGNFTFGSSLPGQNKIISDLTRPNSLFLSAAAQNDHKPLEPVLEFFNSIRIDQAVAVGSSQVTANLIDRGIDHRSIAFLHAIGTGVFSYQQGKKQLDEETSAIMKAFHKAMHEGFKHIDAEIKLDLKDETDIDEIRLAHQKIDGSQEFFDLSWESAGTRRLLVLLGRVFRSLDEGKLLIVDELDASLHTYACEAILALFGSKEINTNGAQLIATTHDTNLLHSPTLRRDQVWFTEKDSTGGTHLYPLTDIKTRKGDNIETGYLQGRFGAIPLSGSLDELLAEASTWRGDHATN